MTQNNIQKNKKVNTKTIISEAEQTESRKEKVRKCEPFDSVPSRGF
jgi:hypothetical protein